MKKLIGTKGYYIIVDDEDYDKLSKYSWSVVIQNKTHMAAQSHIDGKTVRIARVILNITDTDLVVDHINGNGLDNRRCNLRVCTQKQNLMNQKSHKLNGCPKGVKVNSYGRYEASIYHNGVRYYLGSFDDANDAAMAYDAKAKELFGEFAFTNTCKRDEIDFDEFIIKCADYKYEKRKDIYLNRNKVSNEAIALIRTLSLNDISNELGVSLYRAKCLVNKYKGKIYLDKDDNASYINIETGEKFMSIHEICKKENVKYSTMSYRIRSGNCIYRSK